jgi:putative membrane protein
MTPMPVIAQVFALLAALLHVLFFYFESVTFAQPATWRRFGLTSQAEADTLRTMAFNQGFYNLFLAIGIAIGIILVNSGNAAAGEAVVLVACASMVAAGSVLVLSNRALARSAAIQAIPPLVAIVASIAL